MQRLDPIFKNACPNCGGPISAERLEKGLPCSKCLPNPVTGTIIDVAGELARRGTLKGFIWLYDLERRFTDFKFYFESRIRSSLWSAQSSWARRLLSLESMAIIAPTGVGKSTLLQVYTSYRVDRDNWRVLYLVPTENLARQVSAALRTLLQDNVAFYYGSMGKKQREEALRKIEKGEYAVLVVTTSFLQRRFNYLEVNKPFNLVIVDDVDSLLRNSKNIDRVLMLLGYSPEAINVATRLVKEKLRLYTALAAGKEEKVDKLRSEIALLESKLRSLTPKNPGQLVIASATGRPRGLKHLLFKELLGFEVGGGTDYMRNVRDSYLITNNYYNELIKIIKSLGPGGLIYISQLYGKNLAKMVYAKLNESGIPAGLALAGSRRSIDKLSAGSVWVLVGVATRYGVVVRGVDLPDKVRYAIFLGVPAREMAFWDAVASPRRLLAILYYMADNKVLRVQEYINDLKRYLDKIPDITIVSAAFKNRIKPEGLLAELIDLMNKAAAHAREWLKSRLKNNETIRIGGIVIEKRDEDLIVIIPDAPTYLQASGRTSRLFKGAMTYGLSIIIERRKNLIDALWERLSWYTSSKPIPFKNINIYDELKLIEESRKGKGKKVKVKSTLLIVESPTKAKTIAWFWGRPSRRRKGRLTIYETSATDPETGTVYLLTITATKGHLYDLSIDEEDGEEGIITKGTRIIPVYAPVKRCLECGHQYAGSGPCPRCGSYNIIDASRRVAILRKLATEVDEIVIASDPDREGEKIAWDVYLALKPYNPNIRRGRFHEVTREAILQALRNASNIDMNLVGAQIARRIEDRWIGFKLSSHLWSVFEKRWLGAGRVQTPVLGWIVDKYEEYIKNKGYKIIAVIDGGRIYFFTEDSHTAKEVKKYSYVEVVDASYWNQEYSPPPPFTTDSLLYEASKRYGYSTRFTMRLAQDLFESGLITYHRTDSTRVSKTGMSIALAYLNKIGLTHLYKPRQWSDSGAHEAIRPTRPVSAEELERLIAQGVLRVSIKLKRSHIKLYKLIFERFIASQMIKSIAVIGRIKVKLGPLIETLEGPVDWIGEGFHNVYKPWTREWASGLSPGRIFKIKELIVRRSSRISLFKSGDIVRLMKKRKIGRPSTYAKAIDANRRHGYIIESKRSSYLIPTRLGIDIYKYLSQNFYLIVSEETSRKMEEELEKIERGEKDPVEYLDEISQMIKELLLASTTVSEKAIV